MSMKQVRQNLEALWRDLPADIEIKRDQFAQTFGPEAHAALTRIGALKIKRRGNNLELMLAAEHTLTESGNKFKLEPQISCGVFLSKQNLDLIGITGISAKKDTWVCPWGQLLELRLTEECDGGVKADVTIKAMGISTTLTLRVDANGRPR